MKTFSSALMLFFSLCTASILSAQALPGMFCSEAIPVECNSTVTGSTIGNPTDAVSGGAICGTSWGTGGQMWYAYTSTGDNQVTLMTCGSGTTFDTKINVYSGTCDALVCVGGNDDGCNLQSSYTFLATTGTTYLIRVGGFATTNGAFALSVVCDNAILGCTDPGASNYNPEATVSDGSCEYSGCTDPSALNYSPSATVDDGSCVYCNGENSVLTSLYICTFSNGGFVSMNITDPSGNVVFSSPVLGNGQIFYYDLCLDASTCYTVNMTNTSGAAGWYGGYFWINGGNGQVINESLDPNLVSESTYFSVDGSCTAIPGCTDPNATNYNPFANVDNGSCQYPVNCENATAITINMNTGAFANECSFYIVNADGNIVYQSQPYTVGQTSYFETVCLADGCYTVFLNDSFGDGWNGGYVNFMYNGIAVQFSLAQGSSSAGAFSLNTEEPCTPNVSVGCTNPLASNYDPIAIYDDGSCIIEGCTDPNAMNYDGTATFDNGSCEYCNGEGSVMAQLYICTFANGQEVELVITDDAGNVVYTASNLGTNVIFTYELCLNAGVCYTATMINNAGPYGWYNGYFWINAGGVQIINASPSPTAQSQSLPFSVNGMCSAVYGCMDPAATNYNPDAQLEDGSCIYPVGGCTDSTALNYNPAATEDDGSCVYPEACDQNLLIVTLTPGVFVNEASYDIIDANGMLVMSGSGSSTLYACVTDGCYVLNMYDTFGDGWDGGGYITVNINGVLSTYTLEPSLSYGNVSFGINAEGCVPTVYGCTDSTALNYNPAATEDDGSCVYAEDCNGTLVNVVINTQNWGSEMSWDIVAADGSIVASGSGYSSWNSYSQFVCLADGCYEMQMHDSWGDGWNGGYFQIFGNNIYAEGTVLYGNDMNYVFGINSDCGVVEGCTDPEAINYNPAATYDNGSCFYNNINGGNMPQLNNGLELEFSLFPNPANSGININLNNLEVNTPISISVSSLDGKLVSSQTYGNTEENRMIQMNVEELAAGYYFVRVDNGSKSQTIPMIKQ